MCNWVSHYANYVARTSLSALHTYALGSRVHWKKPVNASFQEKSVVADTWARKWEKGEKKEKKRQKATRPVINVL